MKYSYKLCEKGVNGLECPLKSQQIAYLLWFHVLKQLAKTFYSLYAHNEMISDDNKSINISSYQHELPIYRFSSLKIDLNCVRHARPVCMGARFIIRASRLRDTQLVGILYSVATCRRSVSYSPMTPHATD